MGATFLENMHGCDLCGDYGRLGRHRGEMVYCGCAAGVAAELEDRDHVLNHIADELYTMPIVKSNGRERRALWARFEMLKSEYDHIERTRWMPLAVGT